MCSPFRFPRSWRGEGWSWRAGAGVVAVLAAVFLGLTSPAMALPEESARTVPSASHATVAKARPAKATVGVASWYGGVHVGRPTASGEIHSATQRTAAHPNLPFGTLVKVTNLRNGRSSVVKVNDRGPFIDGRIIDVSELAARDLAMRDSGLAMVRLEVLSSPSSRARRAKVRQRS